MKTKSTKQIVITVAVIVAICAVFALLYFGLSQLLHIDKGQVVAEYDGNLVYESDVQDIINYNLITQTTDKTTEAELQMIMIDSIQTYVKYKVMEIDLKEKGYVIDEDVLKDEIKLAKDELEKAYGYNEWCDMYRVSKDFLEEDLRRYALASLYYEYAKGDVEVTEAEALDYYSVHALEEYAEPAGYYWTAILRPVLEVNNTEEMTAAKAEMEAYLEKINSGVMTFDEADKELREKYSPDLGYVNMQFSGEDYTAFADMVELKDEAALQILLADIDKHYADRDPNAAKDSEQYSNYMNYIANTFKANVYYSLQHMEIGDVCEAPLQSFAGYYLIRLDSCKMTNDFTPFEEVEADIIAILMSEKMEAGLVEYFKDIQVEYNVIYY